MDTRPCEACGHPMEESSVFCSKCGALLESGPAWSVLLTFVPFALLMAIVLVLAIFG